MGQRAEDLYHDVLSDEIDLDDSFELDLGLASRLEFDNAACARGPASGSGFSSERMLSSAPVSSRNAKRVESISDDAMAPNPVLYQEPSPGNVKNKLRHMWNQMRYGWTVNVKTSFDGSDPIWLLGRIYQFIASRGRTPRTEEMDQRHIQQFELDFQSRLWFTYRKDFSKIGGTSLTSDCGWGCMIRSGQMMLAQGLVMHFLGREWLHTDPSAREQEAFHEEIIRWFGDSPGAAFGVHKLVRLGQNAGKKVGEWYGPASIAYILSKALQDSQMMIPLLQNICIYVAQDCTIYEQDVIDLCQGSSADPRRSGGSHWCSVLVLVPVRLGSEALNPVYIDCLKWLFSLESCIGIIGGKPKHSLYFIGFQGEKLIYLDPHYCQDVVDLRRDFPTDSFHCKFPRKLTFSKMDPSCTIGFYLKTRSDFQQFCRLVPEKLIPPRQRIAYPIITVHSGRRRDAVQFFTQQEANHRLSHHHHHHYSSFSGREHSRSKPAEFDDYVFI